MCRRPRGEGRRPHPVCRPDAFRTIGIGRMRRASATRVRAGMTPTHPRLVLRGGSVPALTLRGDP